MTKINFGTGGFRGIIADDFTKENVQKICQALSNIADNMKLKKEICIGYDNRFMSENFAKWSAEVFCANDFFVELFDTASATPVVMFENKLKHNDLGLMITASHNPHQYNGMKVFVKDGKDADVDFTNLIKSEFEKINDVKTINITNFNKCKKINKINEFVASIIENQKIPKCEDLKVVYDAKFGSTIEELNIFSNSICLKNYVILNGYRDPIFGGTTPCPSPDNINELRQKVLEMKADIGFALDADGDRLAVIDKFGNYIDNNYILALIYYFFVKYENKKGGIVRTIATSTLSDKVAKKAGFDCYEVPVGFKYVSSKLLETNALIGGESSGGLAVQNHIWGKDSLLSIALCLKIMKTLNKPFNEIINELKEYVNGYDKYTDERQYHYLPEKEEFIKTKIFKDKILPKCDYKIRKIVYKDYLKIYYENDNWLLVRFSGTEPVLRIMIEVDSEKDGQKLIGSMEKLLKLN